MANPISINNPTLARHRVEAPLAAIHITLAWAAAWIIWSIDMGAWLKDRLDRFEETVLAGRVAPLPGVVLAGVVAVAVIGWIANQ